MKWIRRKCGQTRVGQEFLPGVDDAARSSRSSCTLLFILALLMMLMPCVARAAEQVHLRLERPADGIRGAGAAAERAVLDTFRNAHPEIKVEEFVRLRMEGPRAEATLYMSMAGQTAPDALYVYGRSMQKYIEQGFLLPLDDYLTDEIRNDPTFKKMLPTVSRDGHVYGIPAKVAATALLYRKDLFAAAGLDPDQPPKNWDELLAFSRKLTIPSKGQYGFVIAGGLEAGWRFPNFVWQAGGEMVRRDGDHWRLSLDEPAAVKALQLYKDMCWGAWRNEQGIEMRGCARVDSTGKSKEHVIEGRGAMTIVSTTGDIGRFIPDPGILGVAPLPAGPAGSAGMLEGEFWGINALLVNDPARREAAWKYIRFAAGDDAKRITTRVCVEAGAANNVPPDWLKKFGYASELQVMPKAWLTFCENMLENGRLEPFAPGYDQVATDVLGQLDEVLYSDSGNPEKVLRAINERANTAFFATTPPEVMRSRRYTARVIFGVVIASALGAVVWNLRMARLRRRSLIETPEATGGPRAADRQLIARLGIVFLLPAVLTIFVWNYYPLVRGAVLAFLDYRVTGTSMFTGLDNFIGVFTSDLFWLSLIQTLVYVGLSLVIGFLLPIVLAILLSEISFGRIFFRTLFYLPAVTSGVIVLSIWKMMYDTSPQGVFNQALVFMTGTWIGKLLTAGSFTLLWWAITAMLGTVVVDAIGSRARRKPALVGSESPNAIGVGVSAMLPFGPGLAMSWHWLPTNDLRPPIAFLLYGAIATLFVLIVSGIFAWHSKREDRETTLRLKRWMRIGAAVVGVVLAWQLALLLQPPQQAYPWLQDPTGFWAMVWVIVPGIWAGVGPGCIIYLAAIKSIPEELYEAADLDGAGPLHKAYHVTFQTLLPLVIINFIGAVIGTFHAMENILVLTGGGPGNRTMTLGMDIFFNAFTHLKFGYATAEAWVMGSLLIGFTVYQLQSLKNMRFKRAGA